MTTVLKMLNDSKGNPYKTHVSMGENKGSYGLSRDDIFYIYNTENLNKYIGLAEKPQKYSMLRIDLDFKSTNTDIDNEFNMKEIISDCISKVRTYLDKYMTKEEFNNDDACILSKPSYIDPKKNIRKYGVHIVFPNIFIYKDNFAIFEQEMKPQIQGFDSMSNNSWLLYGQQKNEFSGSYVVDYVDVQNRIVNAGDYFKNYTIYDINENKIKFTEPIESYYKQIFSILPLNRTESTFTVPEVKEVIRVESNTRKIVENRSIEEIEKEVKILVNMLSQDRSDDRYSWLYVGWVLFNISEDFLYIWKEFSSKFPDKYDEKVCEYQWSKMIEKNLTLGTLHHLAKLDNLDAYNAYKYSKSLSCMNETLNGSHLDVANMFLTLFGNEHIVITSQKDLSFYMWDDKLLLWKLHGKESLLKIVADVCLPSFNKYEQEIVAKLATVEKKSSEEKLLDTRLKQCQKMMSNLKSAPYLSNICKMIGSHSIKEDFESKIINKTTYELPIKDGKLINFKTLEIRDRNMSDFYSFESPVSFDTDLDLDCVEHFFDSITCGDKDLKKYHQLLWGYLMTGEISDRSLHIFYGLGCNGKSSIVNIFQNIMKEFYTALSEDITLKKTGRGASPELMSLLHTRVGSLPESDKKEELNSKRVKTITGDDQINARHLFGHAVTFKTQCKLIWSTNHKPKINVEDQAVLDRIKLIPFNARFEKTQENTNYIKDLQENKLDEFFTWFAVGCNKWYSGDELIPCKSMINAMKTYISENDIVEEFIEEAFDIVSQEEYDKAPKLEKSDYRTKKSTVYAMFVGWINSNNRKDESLGKKEFYTAFGKKCVSIKVKTDDFLCKLKSHCDEDDEEDFVNLL